VVLASSFHKEESMKLQSNLRALVPIGILLVLSVAPLSAQNSLPSPQNASCWESLSALHACAQEQYNREMDYAARCTSYPEYQCTPAPEPSVSSAEIAKKSSKSKTDKKAMAVAQPSSSDSIAATATSQPPDAK
jgi:hypothetical protein